MKKLLYLISLMPILAWGGVRVERKALSPTQDITTTGNLSAATGSLSGDVILGDSVTDTTSVTSYTIFNSSVAFNAGMFLTGSYSGTEAELKASTPTHSGVMYYDETNLAYIQSTGTTNCASFGLIYDGGTAPTGW